MSITHSLTHVIHVNNGAGRIDRINYTDQEVGDHYVSLDLELSEETYFTNINIDVSEIQAFMCWINLNPPGNNLGIKTNSSTVPDQILVVTENVPLIWTPQMNIDNPFTVDVTTGLFFVAEGDPGDIIQVKMRLLLGNAQP